MADEGPFPSDQLGGPAANQPHHSTTNPAPNKFWTQYFSLLGPGEDTAAEDGGLLSVELAKEGVTQEVMGAIETLKKSTVEMEDYKDHKVGHEGETTRQLVMKFLEICDEDIARDSQKVESAKAVIAASKMSLLEEMLSAMAPHLEARRQARESQRRRPAVLDQSEQWVEYDGGAVQSRHMSASRIRVAAGVAVIPPRAFQFCGNLKEVDLSNVTTISKQAFFGCPLERAVWTTAAAVEIGSLAFQNCSSLKAIDLSNATKVGEGAFYGCEALTSISIPPSVDEIDAAFMDCKNLVDVELLGEGLQRVQDVAFGRCVSLERITIPPSVTFVGDGAFSQCRSLVEVTLREGVHSIDEIAFIDCTSLEHINIPPVALVIDIERSNCQLMRSTMPKPQSRTVVASKWLQYMSPSQLAQAEANVREILDRHRQTEEEKIQCIRSWFAYYYLLDVTTMLELAVWRANMDANERDAEARKASRGSCGSDMNVIIPGVLPFLEG